MYYRKQYLHMTDPQITEPFVLKLRAAIDADPELNVSNLAVKAGLSNSSIRLMFKQNRSPRVQTMRKICAALGTTLEEFMSEAETSEEKEIVRLVMQLPEHLRQQLLGYGQALLDADRQSRQAKDEEEK